MLISFIVQHLIFLVGIYNTEKKVCFIISRYTNMKYNQTRWKYASNKTINLHLSRLIIDPTSSLTVSVGIWSSSCLLLRTSHQSTRNRAKAKIFIPAHSPTYLNKKEKSRDFTFLEDTFARKRCNVLRTYIWIVRYRREDSGLLFRRKYFSIVYT